MSALPIRRPRRDALAGIGASVISSKSPAGTEPDFRALLSGATASLRQSGESWNRELAEQVSSTAPVNERGGYLPQTIDLADARFTTPGYIVLDAKGWQLVYSIQGSTPGGVLDFDFDTGGVQPQCELGAVLDGRFSQVRILRNGNSVTAGTARLRIQTQPDVRYGELAKGLTSGVLGNPAGLGMGPAGATTQAYNSAAGNIPTAATDGLSLAGVRGVRAHVVSTIGTTISAGELHWWQWDSQGALWGETAFVQVYALATVNRVWFPGDFENWVPEGRIYPEWRSGTNSGGAGAFIVRMYTWG